MKYARRSVSDQDIRRYEMFSQVCYLNIVVVYDRVLIMFLCRICNNLVASVTTSSSQKAMVLQPLLEQQRPTLASPMMQETMICTHKGATCYCTALCFSKDGQINDCNTFPFFAFSTITYIEIDYFLRTNDSRLQARRDKTYYSLY